MLTLRYHCEWFDLGQQRGCAVSLEAGQFRRRWAVGLPLDKHQHPERIARTDLLLRAMCQRIVMRYLGAG